MERDRKAVGPGVMKGVLGRKRVSATHLPPVGVPAAAPVVLEGVDEPVACVAQTDVAVHCHTHPHHLKHTHTKHHAQTHKAGLTVLKHTHKAPR